MTSMMMRTTVVDSEQRETEKVRVREEEDEEESGGELKASVCPTSRTFVFESRAFWMQTWQLTWRLSSRTSRSLLGSILRDFSEYERLHACAVIQRLGLR